MRLTGILFASLVNLSFTSVATAQVSAVEQFKNHFPEQILRMTEEERQKIPTMYLFAARQGAGPFAPINLTYLLGTLMYPAVTDLSSAIRLYQKDLKEAQTGRLTVSQIHKLQVRHEYQKLEKIGFPHRLVHTISSSHAFLTGTRKILDENIAYPINYVEFKCSKSRNECLILEVNLMQPTENSFAQIFNFHLRTSDRIRITRWENEYIDGIYDTTPDACRITNINFNFKTKEFFEITRNSSNRCDNPDKFGALPQLTKPKIVQIVDGSQIHNEEFSRISETAFSYLSSEFREKIEQAKKAQRK